MARVCSGVLCANSLLYVKQERSKFTIVRWDPDCKDPVLYKQAASVTARFYEMQIIIHRPFIASEQASVLPSLAVCSNAARSCARLLQTLSQRFSPRCVPHLYTVNLGCHSRVHSILNPFSARSHPGRSCYSILEAQDVCARQSIRMISVPSTHV